MAKASEICYDPYMNTANIKKILKRGRLLENEPMSKHTTFRVGGPARYYIIPANEIETAGVIRYFYMNKLPYRVIGNGSNLLVSDKGYEGTVIDLGRHDGTSFIMIGIDDGREEDVLLDCGAGCLLSSVGHYAAQFGAAGFEGLSGIPGCLGGAVVMNAGAFDSEIGDVVESVSVIDKSGKQKKLSKDELSFGYRTSSLLKDGYIVVRAEIVLKKGDKDTIVKNMEGFSAKRAEKQPLEYPSAGSIFKRPEGDYAGRLIEEAGLKGYKIGGAMVSEKHAGFIINHDKATASDIYALILKVRETVKEKSGVTLEPEVKLLGEF